MSSGGRCRHVTVVLLVHSAGFLERSMKILLTSLLSALTDPGLCCEPDEATPYVPSIALLEDLLMAS
jgi:hypothetical protein